MIEAIRVVRALALAGALCAPAAFAGTAPAEIAAGHVIVTDGIPPDSPACAACHGEDGAGRPEAGIPRLAGLGQAYIEEQLGDFAARRRRNDTMEPIARALNATRRRQVAAYFASLPRPAAAPGAAADAARLERGRRLFEDGDPAAGVFACSQCHGPGGKGVGAFSPAIAGQSAVYLAEQLTLWRSGARRDPRDDFMRAVAARLSPGDVADVAAFAASLGAKSPPPGGGDAPADPFDQVARLGERIFRDPARYAPAYVGNQLKCANCHLLAGRKAGSAPLWGAYPAYPAYRSKNGHVNTYEERLQGCFRFSMNGKAPPLGDPVLVALDAYSYLLAKGLPVGESAPGRGFPALAEPPLPGDYRRGAKVFAERCAACHGAGGQGQSSDGKVVFPPLWGAGSFNWGAGMGSIKAAARFIRANMPLAMGGSLSVQEAWDVATFVDSQVRPQDPRFTGDVRETRRKFHDDRFSMYGETVNGVVLGDPASTPPAGTVPADAASAR